MRLKTELQWRTIRENDGVEIKRGTQRRVVFRDAKGAYVCDGRKTKTYLKTDADGTRYFEVLIREGRSSMHRFRVHEGEPK